ncbi:hypothetical protein D3C78_837110 [compost metagenome]
MFVHRRLGQRCAGHVRARHHAGQQDHDGGGGTDQQRIDEHAQGLDKALRGRMVRIGCRHRGNVRRRTHARFVGEQAAFDAIEQGPGHAADRRLDAEGTLDDQHQHARYFIQIDHDHIDRHQQVGTGHERHDPFGNARDFLDTAENHQSGQHGQRHTGGQLGHTKGAQGCIGNGVGLYRTEHQAESDNQADRKNRCCPRRIQTPGDIERRTAAILTVAVTHFIQLRQGAFRVGRGHAQRGHHPHPEHRTRPAEGNGHRHTGKVTGTDPRGQAGTQRLKRRDATWIIRRGTQHRTEELGQMAKLDKAQADSKVDTCSQQAIDQDIPIEKGIQCVDHGCHCLFPNKAQGR